MGPPVNKNVMLLSILIDDRRGIEFLFHKPRLGLYNNTIM